MFDTKPLLPSKTVGKTLPRYLSELNIGTGCVAVPMTETCGPAVGRGNLQMAWFNMHQRMPREVWLGND